jgi:hypothetical protein
MPLEQIDEKEPRNVEKHDYVFSRAPDGTISRR